MTRPRSALISLADTPWYHVVNPHAVGTPAKLIQLAAHRQSRALRGMAAARRVFEVKAA